MNKTVPWVGTLVIFAFVLMAFAPTVIWARGSGIDWHCVPSFGEQKLVGMKCTGIKPSSILHKAGVQDGDIVTSIDGKPTLSPRDMMGSMRDLKQADRAELKVLRGGKEQTLSYTK